MKKIENNRKKFFNHFQAANNGTIAGDSDKEDTKRERHVLSRSGQEPEFPSRSKHCQR